MSGNTQSCLGMKMMYEEQVKKLRELASIPEYCEKVANCDQCSKEDICLSFTNKRIIETATQAADAIEELSKLVDESIPKDDAEIIIAEVAKPQWIPVTERLPECDLGAEVGNIEWISCGMVHAGCFGRGGKYRDAYFRTWTDSGEGMDAKDADYWRAVTLPEPPKEATE